MKNDIKEMKYLCVKILNENIWQFYTESFFNNTVKVMKVKKN